MAIPEVQRSISLQESSSYAFTLQELLKDHVPSDPAYTAGIIESRVRRYTVNPINPFYGNPFFRERDGDLQFIQPPSDEAFETFVENTKAAFPTIALLLFTEHSCFADWSEEAKRKLLGAANQRVIDIFYRSWQDRELEFKEIKQRASNNLPPSSEKKFQKGIRDAQERYGGHLNLAIELFRPKLRSL